MDTFSVDGADALARRMAIVPPGRVETV